MVKIPEKISIDVWYTETDNDGILIDEDEMTNEFSRKLAELTEKYNGK